MESERDGQLSAPLLVRRADPAAGHQVAALLREVPVAPEEVADLLRRRGVLVLTDLTQPPPAPPLAAAAFRVDAGTADLAGIAVLPLWRRRGLGRRLLTATLTAARAEGADRIRACAGPASPAASLLLSSGFTICHYTAQAGGACEYLLTL